MKYSDASNDALIQNEMVQKVMDVYGVNEEAARTFLEDFDPDITTVAKTERGTQQWYEDLQHIIWGNATDAEIEAAICDDEEVE